MASADVLEAVLSEGREKEVPQLERDARLEWVRAMRRRFSPPAMLTPAGEVDQTFFKPAQVVLVQERRWTDAEQDLLYKGLEEYGVGRWRDMAAALLPRWGETELRVKACRALGSQSLVRYAGWRGNRAAAEAECAANRTLGQHLGCWKGGMLVEDAAGSVAAALATGGAAAEPAPNGRPEELARQS